MAKVKTKKFKQHLIKAKRKTKRVPVWSYLKSKNRELMRRRRRPWRHYALGRRIKRIETGKKW
jgi:ribosomal protein L39E